METALELDFTGAQEIPVAGNSFFDQTYFGTKILVVAEKIGDEILICGNMILNFWNAKAEVIIFHAKNSNALKFALLTKPDIIFVAENFPNFDKVLAEICRAEKDFQPEVFKKKIPTTSPSDFYALNLLSTIEPNHKIKFPVPPECQKPLLNGNPLAKMLKYYKHNALKILNADEVFFQMRTDNLANFAEKNATADKFIFDWAESVQLQRIEISSTTRTDFEIILTVEKVDKSQIYLDNVHKFSGEVFGKRNIDTEKIFVKRAEIFGKVEVNFFSNTEQRSNIAPFIKLTHGGNFFYELFVPAEETELNLQIYRYRCDAPIKITAETAEEIILTCAVEGDEDFYLQLGDAPEIILTAEVCATGIYDRTIIRRVDTLAQIQLKAVQWLDKIGYSI